MHKIRLAAEADLQQLLATQATRESPYPPNELIERWVRAGQFWVAVDDEAIVGWVSLDHSFFEEGFVGILWVEPTHRRKGIATALLNHAHSNCETERIWTSTNLSNHPMQSLMESLGWKLSGVLHYLDPDDPELVYVRLPDSAE